MLKLGEKREKRSFPPRVGVIPKVVHRIIHGSRQMFVRKSPDSTTTTNLFINC